MATPVRTKRANAQVVEIAKEIAEGNYEAVNKVNDENRAEVYSELVAVGYAPTEIDEMLSVMAAIAGKKRATAVRKSITNRAARTVSYDVYSFEELSPEAQKKAITWYRDNGASDNYFSESIIDGFKSDMAEKGVSVDKVYYSGFWSQGDGASFTGNIDDIAKYLAANGVTVPEELKSVLATSTCTVQQRGNYVHENTMSLNLEPDGGWGTVDEATAAKLDELDTLIINAVKADAKKLYKDLEEGYEYENSDESIKETIMDNDYEFEADGSMKSGKHASKSAAKGKNMINKKRADYRGSQERFRSRHDYADALVELLGAEGLLDSVVKAMSDDEAFQNFDYISQMNDFDWTSESGIAEDDVTAAIAAIGAKKVSTIRQTPVKASKTVKAGAEFTDEEVAKEMAEKLGVDVADVEVEDGYQDNTKKVTADGTEYTVMESDDAAEALALEQVKQDLESEPEMFSQDFISQHMTIYDTDRRIIANEEADARYTDMRDDDVKTEYEEKFGAPDEPEASPLRDAAEEAYKAYAAAPEGEEKKTLRDAWIEADDAAEADEIARGVKTEPDYDAMREKLVEQATDEIYEELGDPIQYFVKDHGLYTVEELLKQSFISIDTDAAAEDAVRTDSWQHFLSRYDGNSDETSSGFVYWRE